MLTNALAENTIQKPEPSFDLVRLSKSKESVDLAPNTLRAYHEQGLPFYKNGKCVFFSKAELQHFIKSRAV